MEEVLVPFRVLSDACTNYSRPFGYTFCKDDKLFGGWCEKGFPSKSFHSCKESLFALLMGVKSTL